MHKLVEDRPVAPGLQGRPDCLAEEGQTAVPGQIAGFDGVSIENYQPPVGLGATQGDEPTLATALEVGTRTLCVFVTWYPSTTDAERAAAKAILDAVRAEPTGRSSVRVNITLDERWDTG